MKKLWLGTVWVVVVAALIALAVACSGTDAPSAFDPAPGGGMSDAGAKADASKDHPPPRPIDDTPDATAPDDAPAPQITSISPDKGTLNVVGPTITVNGALFVPRSKVLLDGAEIATSFESATQLKATLPDDKLKAIAQLKITVKTAAPGGGTTSEVIFAVENPKPELTSLAPASVPTLSGTTTLTLTGRNFAPGAKVRFGDSDIPSSFKTDTTIEATIPSGLLNVSTNKPVKVTNALPGGGASNELSFAISNPNVTITSITPSSKEVTSASLPLTVKGTGFVSTSVIQFNGAPVQTMLAASDQLQGTIPAGSLTTVADINVTVLTPPVAGVDGGGVSAPKPFSVVYPKPIISLAGVNPNVITAGGNPTDVTITGSLFFPASVITFDGAAANTVFVNDKQLTATLTAAQLATARTIEVKVTNPAVAAGGGGASNAKTITVKTGIPKVLTLEPAAVLPGSPDTTVKVLGVGFVANITAKARVGSGQYTNLTVTYVDSSTLNVVFPAALLTTAGNAVSIVVNNPGPGGGDSTDGSFLQISCNSQGVNVHLNATTTDTLVPDYTADKISRWAANGGACPQDLFPAEQQPANFVVVQNSTTADLFVTAWGVCNGGKGDGFLAFYKGGKAPTNDTERKACFGSVSEGVPLKSPDANGADKCPGLTKQNGGATLKLAACERAVVMLQAYKFDDTDNPPPVSLLVKGESP